MQFIIVGIALRKDNHVQKDGLKAMKKNQLSALN